MGPSNGSGPIRSRAIFCFWRKRADGNSSQSQQRRFEGCRRTRSRVATLSPNLPVFPRQLGAGIAMRQENHLRHRERTRGLQSASLAVAQIQRLEVETRKGGKGQRVTCLACVGNSKRPQRN